MSSKDGKGEEDMNSVVEKHHVSRRMLRKSRTTSIGLSRRHTLRNNKAKLNADNQIKNATIVNESFNFWLNEDDDIYDKLYGEDE